jgi:hypothetical protein
MKEHVSVVHGSGMWAQLPQLHSGQAVRT